MPTKTQKPRLPDLTIRNAKIVWPNFSGTARKYNAAGQRNFHVVIDPKDAQKYEKDGWNIKWHKSREEGEPDWASMKVAVRFDNYPPRIVLVLDGKQSVLDEDSVSLLDGDAKIERYDIVITASYYDNELGKGFKSYLKKAFAILSPDDIEAEYFNKGRAKESEDD